MPRNYRQNPLIFSIAAKTISNYSYRKRIFGIFCNSLGADFKVVRHLCRMKLARKLCCGVPKTLNKNAQFSGLQKGPAERGHVKKRQKSSKSVKNIFDSFRQFSRRAKNVKNRQKASKKYFRHFSTLFAQGTSFPAPFGGL